ncbi:hypothetical protein [Nonomuraea gerenzanensis]|uniref:hypothetical protein n=1 Tax=Nonomuraea gerenzanensis TaxID=93944 RepID=UPI001CDA5430|nr:hypothetical protein [Nonomuraea gerenzanensis]UBU08692.1 hypothetical protein LCN96_30370 [Nonomuraea gerenzanensis]
MLVPVATAAVLTTAPASAATVQQTLLTCQVATTPDRPITFNPPVRLLPRTVTAQAGIVLTGCVSSASSAAHLRSGTMTVHSTGRASCAGVRDVHGKGTITWYGADGRQAGVSTVRPSVEKVAGYNPGDMLLGGRISKGTLAGARLTGTATPTSNVNSCATKGLGTVHGVGRITFTA